jgi:Fic family protein
MAPPHTMVPVLMDNLFNWMNKAKEEVNPLILSSIFHYEFVFIHPFSDGNGRTARLWQTAILADWKDLFKYIQIESIIRKHQDEYYTVIQNCNNAGNSNEFIEFMLKIIEEAVDGMIVEQQRTTQETTQKTTQKTTQEKILDLINKNPSITQEELAKALNITRDGISYNIKVLKENGIIERVGSTRKGKWKIL